METDDSGWTPPVNPCPQLILEEAVKAARNGRYEESLVRHRWFFDHALEYEQSQYGVRLSFALGYWRDLAEVYPPAMVELRELRKEVSGKVLDGVDLFHSFHDAVSINRVLDDVRATRELFVSLQLINARHASDVYRLAQPALVTCGDYEICNRYLHGPTAVDSIIEFYRHNMSLSYPAPTSEMIVQNAIKSLRNEGGTVIALLVVGRKMKLARTLSERILAESGDESVRETITKALAGEFPPQRE